MDLSGQFQVLVVSVSVTPLLRRIENLIKIEKCKVYCTDFFYSIKDWLKLCFEYFFLKAQNIADIVYSSCQMIKKNEYFS